jgi:hypothetical protein
VQSAIGIAAAGRALAKAGERNEGVGQILVSRPFYDAATKRGARAYSVRAVYGSVQEAPLPAELLETTQGI